MSSPVFVVDSQGTPLMPMSAAYARKLLRQRKAQWHPHHAFTVLQLTQEVPQPALLPLVVGIIIHLSTAELLLIADGGRTTFPLLHIIIDLRTDLSWRLRRRSGHRRRRRGRGRYRASRRYGRPFKARRPSMARSVWATMLRKRNQARLEGRRYIPPTMRWRAQAIDRTIMTLSRLIPISHIVMLGPAQPVDAPHIIHTTMTLRQQLIDMYGEAQPDGTRRARCMYCGTTEAQVEVDHILPVSRGGTDAWSNRVLACAACNARKGNRTPQEARMPLLIPTTHTHPSANRAGVYIRWTAYVLAAQLKVRSMPVLWRQEVFVRNVLSLKLLKALDAFASEAPLPLFVAKPIGRDPKQVFSARNYPYGMPLQRGFARMRRVVKRRVTVNRAMMLIKGTKRWRVQVLAADSVPEVTKEYLITRGMLCEAIRAGHIVQGIVAAIHTTGRLTLLVAVTVERNRVTWKRVVISPRKYLHVRATDRILFLRPQGK